MDIFEQYGIRQVANVTLYSIQLDENDEEVYVPVIFFDSLKVSSINETKSQKAARGGIGNPRHIIWDYGKDITVTLQDALITFASQSATWGGNLQAKKMKFQGLSLIKKFERNTEGEIEDINKYTLISEPMDVIIDNINDFEIVTFENNTNHQIEKEYIWKGRAYFVSKYKNLIQTKENIVIKYNITNQFTQLGGYRIYEIVNGIETEIITFYKNVNDVQVESGYFFMSYNRTKNFPPPNEIIYGLDTAINNVYYLERFEQCIASKTFAIDTDNNLLHNNYRYIHKYDNCELTVYYDPKTMQPYQSNINNFTKRNGEKITGNLHLIHKDQIYYKWTRKKAHKYHTLGQQIVIDATHFPGFYKLVGETKIRDRYGIDSMYQFEIPLCKMNATNTLSLTADGAPTIVDMKMDVLRKDNGQMMKLTKYDVELNKYDGIKSSSTYPINIPTKAEDMILEEVTSEAEEEMWNEWPEDKDYTFSADFSTEKQDDEKIDVKYRYGIKTTEIWGDMSSYEKEEYETLMAFEERTLNPDEYSLYEEVDV